MCRRADHGSSEMMIMALQPKTYTTSWYLNLVIQVQLMSSDSFTWKRMSRSDSLLESGRPLVDV